MAQRRAGRALTTSVAFAITGTKWGGSGRLAGAPDGERGEHDSCLAAGSCKLIRVRTELQGCAHARASAVPALDPDLTLDRTDRIGATLKWEIVQPSFCPFIKELRQPEHGNHLDANVP